jgi:PAS domain S-box-containing protein
MSKPHPEHIENNQQSLWAGVLLALLTLSCYTVVFFSIDTSQNTFLLHRDLYLISIAFLLIMMLIIFITKRRHFQNEQTLQATQKEYLDLLQYAADPVVILSELGIIISANSSVETISGYSPKELIGHHFLKVNILHRSAMAIAAREFLQLIRGIKRPPFELTMIRKDNVPFITEAHASKIKDINGKPVIHVIMRDITERKKTEEKLLNEKTKAQNYLNIADVIITTLDQNANVTLINKKGCEILEYSEEEIIGQNWFEKFLLPESSLSLKHIFNQLMQGEKILLQNYENYVLTKTGKKTLNPLEQHINS